MNAQPAVTYEQLKKFLITALPYVFDVSGLQVDEHPIARMEKLEHESKRKAFSAMKTAVADLLAAISRESPEKLEALSQALRAAKAPSLPIIRAWSSRKTGALLARGSVTSDSEFEQISALLDIPGLEKEERDRMQEMLDRYEFGK